MTDNEFRKITYAEFLAVNGGGLAGAAAGIFIGGAAGSVVCIVACCNSLRSGSSAEMAVKAGATAFGATVVSCVAVGATVPF